MSAAVSDAICCFLSKTETFATRIRILQEYFSIEVRFITILLMKINVCPSF